MSLPQDYYGITFPGPAAALSSRDGSLANNPYSGTHWFPLPSLNPLPRLQHLPPSTVCFPVLLSHCWMAVVIFLLQVKSQSLGGATPPPRLPPPPCRPRTRLPPHRRLRRRPRAAVAARPRRRATTPPSRPSSTRRCPRATATRACPTTPGCPACRTPSSTAPPCSCRRPRPSSTAWA